MINYHRYKNENINYCRLRMYAIKVECPEKTAKCKVENPSRVVSRKSAPYLTKTLANGKLPSRQHCCKAVRPSLLKWLMSIRSTWRPKKRSISSGSFSSSNWLWSSISTWLTWVRLGKSYFKMVTGAKGCRLSSYLLAYFGTLLLNWSALPNRGEGGFEEVDEDVDMGDEGSEKAGE